MHITINPVKNGSMVTTLWSREDTGEGEQEETFAFVYDTESGKQGLVDMLRHIMSELETDSRYDRERVVVKMVHGDKYICEHGCDICEEDE